MFCTSAAEGRLPPGTDTHDGYEVLALQTTTFTNYLLHPTSRLLSRDWLQTVCSTKEWDSMPQAGTANKTFVHITGSQRVILYYGL
jgi:hypothetical protein